MSANLFADIPDKAPEELFTNLLENPHYRIERIVSYGQASPVDFWYEQDWDEWVLLLKGSAELDLDGRKVGLTPGDYLLIPTDLRHRVCKTDPHQPTIWLAIHLEKHKNA